MKTIVAAIVLLVLALGVNAQLTTNQPARLKCKIEWFQGSTNSGMWGDSINFAPECTMHGNGGRDTCTSPGYEHELKWTYVGRNGSKDVYQFTFTRHMKAGSSNKITTSKDIQFDGNRIVVFEDDLHTVVMESPSQKDLKGEYSTNIVSSWKAPSKMN